MSNKIIPFENAGGVPAHLAELFGLGNDDLAGGVSASFPVISFKGKTWAVVQGDQRDVIMRLDDDTPAPYIDVVIVKSNANLSKVYYPHGFEEGAEVKPLCYSHDGKTPASDAIEPQSNLCATCQWNAWGSKTTEAGKKAKACADSRRLAIAAMTELSRPMLLRVPAASLRSLMAYADTLTARRTPYQAVVTRIGFDHTQAHPQLTFKAVRFVNSEEAAAIAETMKSDTVAQIVGVSTSAPAGVPASAPAPKPAAVVTKTVAKPATAPPKKAPARVSEVEVDAALDMTQPAPEAPKPQRSSKVAALISEADSELDAALAELDD